MGARPWGGKPGNTALRACGIGWKTSHFLFLDHTFQMRSLPDSLLDHLAVAGSNKVMKRLKSIKVILLAGVVFDLLMSFLKISTFIIAQGEP